MAIFLPRVLVYQKREISLPMGYKTARPKSRGLGMTSFQDFKLRKNTDFFNIFLFSDKQRTFVPFLGELISSQ